LKDQRNENIHAVWAEMVHADTGEFAQFTRSRYDKDKATHTTKWDVGVPPSIEELEKLVPARSEKEQSRRQSNDEVLKIGR
jgi:hypothetical protein